jgi:hypothetical protein
MEFDALRGIKKELADIDREVEKAESAKTIEAAKTQNIEDEILATSESRGFAAQMANVPIEPMSAAERDRVTEQDRKRMEAFQASTDRLEAIPGQRIDFSKRQELLELAALTPEARTATLLLETGVSARWQYAFWRRSPQATAEAEQWQQIQQGSLHLYLNYSQ